LAWKSLLECVFWNNTKVLKRLQRPDPEMTTSILLFPIWLTGVCLGNLKGSSTTTSTICSILCSIRVLEETRFERQRDLIQIAQWPQTSHCSSKIMVFGCKMSIMVTNVYSYIIIAIGAWPLSWQSWHAVKATFYCLCVYWYLIACLTYNASFYYYCHIDKLYIIIKLNNDLRREGICNINLNPSLWGAIKYENLLTWFSCFLEYFPLYDI
jgi:hypothetical protein